MQRLRVSTVAAALTVMALFMVGVVLAQAPAAPAAPAPVAQVATPRAVQATTTGGDYPRQVYVALAEQAVSHVMDMIQTTGATSATGATGATSATPAATAVVRLATPTAGLSLTGIQPLTELVVNMRAVLGVSERALDDLEAIGPSAACPNLADDVRDADIALLDVQRTLRRATTGTVTLETRVMNQLTRAQSNLQGDMTCLMAGTTSGGMGAGTAVATTTTGGATGGSTAVGTPGAARTPTPVGTARPAAANTNQGAAAAGANSGGGPLDAINRFLQGMRERLGGGNAGPTPTPRPTR